MEESVSTADGFDVATAIAEAVEHQRNNRLPDAEAIYLRVLEVEPDRADVVHYRGILAHQGGRIDDARVLLERSLELEPDRADWFSNLAIVLQADGRLDEAIEACRRSIELEPRHANARSNLGALLRLQGRLAEAEDAYRGAIEIDPEHAAAYMNLGILHAVQGRLKDAVSCYCRVITLSPNHREARRLLALAHSTLGETDKAAAIYEEWFREEPHDPVVRHMLAACTGRDVPHRASDECVRDMFDSFATSFDDRLAHLEYRAPQLVAAMLSDPDPEAKSLDVLDAGCGTGLCGPLVAPFARRLTGVDLSKQMLARARKRGLYDDLFQGELTAFLRGVHEAYDVIISADTLVYFGTLEEVIGAAAGALRAGGVLIFTLEAMTTETPGQDFLLAWHGRYEHSREYVDRLLVGAGLTPEIHRAELRLEGGAPVQGLVIRARKAVPRA